MNLPSLSFPDPTTSVEGTLDPLGLYPIADALGVKLIPGIRERMSHPRFLTLIAVSSAVCQKFDPDEIAKDGVSEPWQVFEWHVVEGLVRCVKDEDRLIGLPGQDKVRAAIHGGIRISARSYLKTPNVFGFHGVYRLLARTVDVTEKSILGESGYRLIEVWRSEQGLDGFLESRHGKGADFYSILHEAVADAMIEGAVDRRAGWRGWQMIADSMGPLDPGERESRELKNLILKTENEYTSEILRFILSPESRRIQEEIIQKRKEKKIWSERPFHEALLAVSSSGLKEILAVILIFERFSRLLQDSFDECLYNLSIRKTRLKASQLAETEAVRKAHQETPDLFAKVLEKLEPIGLSTRFSETFQVFADRMSVTDWTVALMEHHRTVQALKPPGGKLPWVERFDDGSYIIRTAYFREEKAVGDDSYVHSYRLAPLRSFATDLRLLS